MRAAIYDHLQRLPVAFHDRWPAGQLMSRAVSDLATIRRFLAFGLVFLFVNLTTFLVGVVILLALSWQLGLIIAALAVPLVALCFMYESRYQVLARRSRTRSATWPPWSRSRCWASGSSRRSAAAGTSAAGSWRGRGAAGNRDEQGQGDLQVVGGDHRAARGRLRAHAVPRASARSPTASVAPARWSRSSASRWACAGRSTRSAGCWRCPTTRPARPSGTSR